MVRIVSIPNKLIPKRDNSAFTIIEVVLVLAVASLILLIVLSALPQLQKSRRDSKRKSDVAELSSYISEYATSTGSLPSSSDFDSALSGTTNSFSDYVSDRDGNVVFNDPDTGTSYSLNPSLSQAGDYNYQIGHKCSVGNTAIESTTYNSDYALILELEDGVYCVDNVI